MLTLTAKQSVLPEPRTLALLIAVGHRQAPSTALEWFRACLSTPVANGGRFGQLVSFSALDLCTVCGG